MGTVATPTPEARQMYVGHHRYGHAHTFDEWAAQDMAQVDIDWSTFSRDALRSLGETATTHAAVTA